MRPVLFLTELVSRVLYAFAQQSSIFTADFSAVQALRLCHHTHFRRAAEVKDFAQGVASDRVYSVLMLP